MADPTSTTTSTSTTTTTDPTASTPFIPTTDQQNALDQYVNSVQANAKAQSDLDVIMNNVSTSMADITTKMNTAGVSLDNLNTLTTAQTNQFTLVVAGAIKTREAFANLANVDYSGLSTFSEQVNDLREAFLSGGTAASDMAGLVGNLGKQLLGMGVPQSAINAATKQGTAAVLDLAGALMKHADNMLRSQTATIQMAGATGELGEVWGVAGGDLQNINDLLNKQTEMLGDTIEATGLSARQVEDYYGQLGQIPGALKAVVDTGEKGGETTSMLTATIQTATGTGRKYADVLTDLKTAFKDYGLVGEDALRFSVRMSDVSTRLKAPIEDVTNALRGSADAFKMFATGQESASKSAESLAKTLNTYGKALESTGLSATSAVEVASQLSNQVAKLSVGQLSYISQQTGGAGGLVGAAQETVKLQNDPGAVVADAMKTLQQQFGRIVTVQEAAASGSEALASQNEKQAIMLQQLLGPLAKDQATANRLLEAMKNQNEGSPGAIAEALKPTGVQDAAEQGLKVQQGSYSELTKIRSQIERMRYVADQGAGRSFQQAITARPTATPPTLAQGEVKNQLAETMRSAREHGGQTNQSLATGLQTGAIADTRGTTTSNIIRDTTGLLKDIPTSLKAAKDALMGAYQSGNQELIKQQENELQQRKTAYETIAKQSQGNPDAQKKASDEANAVDRLLRAGSTFKSESNTGSTTSAGNQVGQAVQGFVSPSTQVGQAAQASVTNQAATNATATPQTSPTNNTPGTNNQQHNIQITGKFTIDCPHCGRPNDVSPQAKIISPQSFGQ